MFFIYVIFSEKLDRFYIGTTDNVERRILEHNNRTYTDAYTSKGIPWSLKLEFQCESSEKAYALEKFIKKMKSKTFINKVISDSSILEDIQRKL